MFILNYGLIVTVIVNLQYNNLHHEPCMSSKNKCTVIKEFEKKSFKRSSFEGIGERKVSEVYVDL